MKQTNNKHIRHRKKKTTRNTEQLLGGSQKARKRNKTGTTPNKQQTMIAVLEKQKQCE